MTTVTYQVWVISKNGPLTVQESDSNGRDSWLTEHEAIELAKYKKLLYDNIDFVVVEETMGYSSESKKRRKVFSTGA